MAVEPKIILPKPIQSSDTRSSDDDEDNRQSEAAPKKFLAHSLVESLFNGLLQKVRHKGIPKQKGFLHLNRITGYGPTASTKKFSTTVVPPKLALKNFIRSTIKLTRQTIQEACEKERQKRLRSYHQDGIPRYRPFIDFLDEFKHLVREAERQDQTDFSKKQVNLESNWSNIMEDIRNKGLLKSINEQVEAQRMDTIYNIWAILRNKTDRGQNAAMATVHEAKCVVQEELKNAVKNMQDQAKVDDEQLTNYYADLKEQMVDSLHRKLLAFQSNKQIHSELKTRLEQDNELKDDPIRKKVMTEKPALLKELKDIHALVMKEENQQTQEMISRQEKLKETVLDDVIQTYNKKKTFAEISRNKVEQIKEERLKGNTKDPQKELVKEVWTKLHKEAMKKAKQ